MSRTTPTKQINLKFFGLRQRRPVSETVASSEEGVSYQV